MDYPKNIVVSCLVSLVVWCAGSVATAAVEPAGWIGDNVVLQRGEHVPILGRAAPGEQINVAFAGRSATTTANEQGRWSVDLGPLDTEANQSDGRLIIKGSSGDVVILKDVLVGDVWLCSGASNMAMPVMKAKDAEKEMEAAHYPRIRFFSVWGSPSEHAQADCGGVWTQCNPGTVEAFSAVGYYFGRELHEKLGVPIGLIRNPWGRSHAEPWATRESLASEPTLKQTLVPWDEDSRPAEGRPASLYNGKIAPLTRSPIRGVVWYQGEADVADARRYRTLFPALIRGWREAWGNPRLPFGFVQLAPYDYRQMGARVDPTACAELREAQLMTLRDVPEVGMAVTIDLGESDNPRPVNKQEVGHRLALWALAKVYGQDVAYSGPLYESMTVDGRRIRLRFAHADGGLATGDGKALSHFSIAGADKRFHPATARIEGSELIVHSSAVAKPVAVRYAWRDDAVGNLANQAGLPASPFRTDDWD